MKKRIACICVLLLLLPGILLGTALSLPDFYQDSYYAELPAMADYLHQAEGNRLILIGGTSAMLSLRRGSFALGTWWCLPSSRSAKPCPTISVQRRS